MLAKSLLFARNVRHARSVSTGSAPIQKVGVIGAGQMGVGIACVAAKVAKLPVVLVDQSQKQLDSAQAYLEAYMKKEVSKGRATQNDLDSALSLMTTTTSTQNLGNADIVIEAVSESIELKQSIFAQLIKITKPTAILASNTSSISITKIAAATGSFEGAQRVIGMHFMNPVVIMPLVELIPGLATSAATLDATTRLAQSMCKTTTTSRDVPGFIANRLLMPYLNEAIFALHERLAPREDIDATMKLGMNMPMGPLTLADFIGLDTVLAILRILHTQLGEDKYRPCPLLQTYVDAGWLGKKCGRGFYEYDTKNILKAAAKK